MSEPAGPPSRVHRVATATVWLWVARAAWLLTAVVGGAAVGGALDGRSRAVQVVGTTGAWVGFAAGAVALAVVGVTTLTVARAVVPAGLVVALWCALAGATAVQVVALALPAAIATVAVASAEFGRVYLQAAAYGDERRFGLRSPYGFLAATALTWAVATVALLGAVIAWPARAWLVAAVTTIVAAASLVLFPLRWHQLSRRWLVLVPAGVVVHDPMVMADTLMVRRSVIASIEAASLSGVAARAANLTGPLPGLGIVVTLRPDDAATAVLAPRRDAPTGTAIHVSAFAVAPSRPGAFLRAAADRNLPVTTP